MRTRLYWHATGHAAIPMDWLRVAGIAPAVDAAGITTTGVASDSIGRHFCVATRPLEAYERRRDGLWGLRAVAAIPQLTVTSAAGVVDIVTEAQTAAMRASVQTNTAPKPGTVPEERDGVYPVGVPESVAHERDVLCCGPPMRVNDPQRVGEMNVMQLWIRFPNLPQLVFCNVTCDDVEPKDWLGTSYGPEFDSSKLRPLGRKDP